MFGVVIFYLCGLDDSDFVKGFLCFLSCALLALFIASIVVISIGAKKVKTEYFNYTELKTDDGDKLKEAFNIFIALMFLKIISMKVSAAIWVMKRGGDEIYRYFGII